MRASNKRALSLLLSAALIVVSFVIYASFIRPEYEAIRLLRGELRAKTEAIEQQNALIAQVQQRFQEYQEVSRFSDTLSLALPEEASVSSVMAQVNAIAQASGLSLQSVGINYLTVSPPTGRLSSARGIGTLRLNLRLLGSYAGVKRFLQTMETNIRLMDVQTLQITPVGKSNQDLYLYNITVDTYYQSQ